MAILATFEEEELDRLYTEVAVGGPIFQTGVVGNGKAVQQRTIDRYDAIRSFEIQFGGMNQAERLRLEEFFVTKWGRAIGFRFYPPNDRVFQNDVIGVGDGTNTTFYLRRNYRSRSRYYSRRIVKPVKNTIVITVNGSVATPTVDWDQGVVTLTPAPAAGAIVRCASGEYDIPVYFDVDEFNVTDYGPFADWNSIKVTEILPSLITTVGNDISPLSLAFTSPHSNETENGFFDVTLTHTGVTKVYLYLNDVLWGADWSAPFSFTNVWNPAGANEWYRVTALGVNESGDVVEASIDLYSSASLSAETNPPTAPILDSPIMPTSESLLIEWSPSTDDTGIGSYEYRVDGGTPVNVGNVVSYVVTGLAAATAYDFEVRAKDVWGNYSAWSNLVSGTTLDDVPDMAMVDDDGAFGVDDDGSFGIDG